MKTFIKINLNKAESSEVLKERVIERGRWIIFGILIFSLLAINFRSLMIGFGYNNVIQKKKTQIKISFDKSISDFSVFNSGTSSSTSSDSSTPQNPISIILLTFIA